MAFFSASLAPADPAPALPTAAAATSAINGLGLDLLRGSAVAPGNALLSPFSIQTALAMTYAGADGATQEEMARVLHYPADEPALHASFAALRGALEAIARATAERVADSKRYGGPSEPVTLSVANRLFGQKTSEFRAPFLALLQEQYDAPLQRMDFADHAPEAVKEINAWVEKQTRARIKDLVPPGAINAATRLVLVNAIYLMAPWASEFSAAATAPAPFRVDGKEPADVPTMVKQDQFGFAQREGYQAITIPYSGGLQLLVLLPDAPDGLPALEAKLTAAILTEAAASTYADVILHLPKFRLEPPLTSLGDALQALGMKTAFDAPPGSANFDRMAPRRPNDYLCISEVFHKTFLALDEKGTEAAAATAVMMRAGSAMMKRPEPVEVKVDRPFLFAIQHRESGACLFLGRVTDPR